jgi:putative FmdB family regulatory protein
VPIYEYVCEACGRLTEVMQRMNDPAPACPECGASKLARLVSRTTFQLKGGGWYSDLYSSAKKEVGTGGTKGAAAPASSGDGGAKPASSAPSPAPASGTTGGTTGGGSGSSAA